MKQHIKKYTAEYDTTIKQLKRWSVCRLSRYSARKQGSGSCRVKCHFISFQ